VYIDDTSIGYQCFRASCDANCGYELGKPVPRRFKALCASLGVRIPVSLSMVKNSFQKALESDLNDRLYKKLVYKDMTVPKEWIPLESSGNKKWLSYYNDRKVPTDDILYVKRGSYQGLTVIPMRFFDKIIGFQVVDPTGHIKYRTISDNEHPIAVHGGWLDSPVIVVEGILDAMCLPNTVAIMRSRISPQQAYQLRGRRVIMLPDRSGNDFLNQAKEYGWDVCIPEWDVKDVNEAVQRYGVMVTAQMIKDNTYSNLKKAEVAYRLWRK